MTQIMSIDDVDVTDVTDICDTDVTVRHDVDVSDDRKDVIRK